MTSLIEDANRLKLTPPRRRTWVKTEHLVHDWGHFVAQESRVVELFRKLKFQLYSPHNITRVSFDNWHGNLVASSSCVDNIAWRLTYGV